MGRFDRHRTPCRKKPRRKPAVATGGAALVIGVIGSAALWWGLRGENTPNGARLAKGKPRPSAEKVMKLQAKPQQPAAETIPIVGGR